MAGLGVYPDFAKSQPGNGPTTNFNKLSEIWYDWSSLIEVLEDLLQCLF